MSTGHAVHASVSACEQNDHNHSDICKSYGRAPELLYAGPEVADKREAPLNGGALPAPHQALMNHRGPRQALRSCQELPRVQAAPDQLGRVHQILDAAAQRCSTHRTVFRTIAIHMQLPQNTRRCYSSCKISQLSTCAASQVPRGLPTGSRPFPLVAAHARPMKMTPKSRRGPTSDHLINFARADIKGEARR